MSDQPMIRVDSEWAPLRECVFGWPGQHVFGEYLQDAEIRPSGRMAELWKSNVGRGLAEADPELFARWAGEIDGAVAFLRARGVIVRQPTRLSEQNMRFPRGQDHGSMTGWMRDPFVTIGDKVIELAPRSLFHRRQRFAIRHILFGVMDRGGRYFAQPDGGGDDNIEDLPGFGYLEGGDIFVLGKTILVGHSGAASNADGARWLQHALGGDYRVELVEIAAGASHLDLFLMTPREGVAVACLAAFPDGLPEILRDWDIIDVPFPVAKAGCGVNQMVLDDRTVLVAAETVHDPLVEALERRGFDVPRLPYGTVGMFGGSLRCAYQPLARY